MSSIIRTGGSNIDRSAELRGLSTDTKPTRANGNEVPHGSTWYNMDDSTKYMYNADNDTWYNIPNGGGGGTGDMQKSVYDPTNTVANAGGIDTYVGTEISDATTEIINTVNSNIGTTSDNLIKDTVGWTNKNLLPITLSSLQEINTNGTWDDNVYTYRNITITVETDIYNLITDIKVNGANTTGSVAFKLTNNFVYQLLSEDKYYISDGVDITAIVDGSAYISVERKKGESGETHYLSTNNENRSTKFTVDYATYDYYAVSIYIPNNSSINNAIFYPMIRRASISDATYEPYRSTVEDELNGIDSAIGTLNANLGIANSRITNLQNNKANISDLGTSAYKNSTSVVTDSTDLVESGAVENLVGWGNKNVGVWSNVTLSGDATVGYKLNANGSSLIAPIKNNTNYTVSRKSTSYGNMFRIILFKNEPSSTPSLETLVIVNNNTALTEYTFNSGVYNYVVFTYDSSNVITQDTAEAMIELGSVKTAYEPYHASVEQTLRDANLINGKNEADISDADKTFTLLKSGERTRYIYLNKEISAGNKILSIKISNASNMSLAVRYQLLYNTTEIVSGNLGSTNNGVYNLPVNIISVINRLYFFISNSDNNNATCTVSDLMISADGGDYEPYYIPLKDVVPTKCDNTVIAPTENGTTASQAYAVNDIFIRNSALCKVTSAISQGDTLSNQFTVTNIGAILTALLNA